MMINCIVSGCYQHTFEQTEMYSHFTMRPNVFPEILNPPRNGIVDYLKCKNAILQAQNHIIPNGKNQVRSSYLYNIPA